MEKLGLLPLAQQTVLPMLFSWTSAPRTLIVRERGLGFISRLMKGKEDSDVM
jgi:hypothetical protein